MDLTTWKTKKEIIQKLKEQGYKVNERTWRLWVERHNILYCQGVHDTYIVHSLKGYKLTKDGKEISASIDDLKKRGLNMLWKASQASRAIGEHMNLKLEFEEFLERQQHE